jgi:dihydroflavonol-4-reductase
VTGGAGFIGARVVRRLCTDNHEVRCLLRPSSRTHRIDDLPVEAHLGDVRDPVAVQRALVGCDAVIHLAAPGGWDHLGSPEVVGTIVQGTAAVLAAARSEAVGRVVYVSSVAAIGGSAEPQLLDEQAPFELRGPEFAYAIAKHAAELRCLEHHRSGHSVVIVNPCEVYGPDDDDFVTAGTLRDALRGPVAFSVRGGTAVAHVDDVAAGICAALDRGHSGERYILGGENLSIHALIRRTLRHGSQRYKPVLIIHGPLLRLLVGVLSRLGLPTPLPPAALPYSLRYWLVDDRKARTELLYQPRSADETLGSVVAWLQAVARQDLSSSPVNPPRTPADSAGSSSPSRSRTSDGRSSGRAARGRG